MIVCFLDCETTGLPKVGLPIEQQPKIIEVGMVKYDTASGKEVCSWSSLVKPCCELPEHITKLTGLFSYQLYDQPKFPEISQEVQSWLISSDAIVAHNAYFDISMLQIEFERAGSTLLLPNKVICTVEETTSISGRKLSLPELWSYALGTPYIEKHRALNDAQDLCEICATLRIPTEAYYGG